MTAFTYDQPGVLLRERRDDGCGRVCILLVDVRQRRGKKNRAPGRNEHVVGLVCRSPEV
jgi:hypothetical protein